MAEKCIFTVNTNLQHSRLELMLKLQKTIRTGELREECENILELINVLTSFHTMLQSEQDKLDKKLTDEFPDTQKQLELELQTKLGLTDDELRKYIWHHHSDIMLLAQINRETQLHKKLQDDLNIIDQELIRNDECAQCVQLIPELDQSRKLKEIDALTEMLTLERTKQNQSQQRLSQIKRQRIELKQQLEQEQNINKKLWELNYVFT